jgi:four helix bundle protein
MNEAIFKARTKQFALDVIALVESLPRTQTAQVLGRQLLRSATSVGANYRAACGARSAPDFVSQMGIVEEDADESLFWFELLIGSHLVAPEQLAPLTQEGHEIVAMTVASIRTKRGSIQNPQSKI